MALPMATYEWPVRLFKMRGFGRVDVCYEPMWDRIGVTLARHSDGQPIKIYLPDDFASMTLEAFRNWVDAEVEKISGQSDFPTITIGDTSPCEMNPDPLVLDPEAFLRG